MRYIHPEMAFAARLDLTCTGKRGRTNNHGINLQAKRATSLLYYAVCWGGQPSTVGSSVSLKILMATYILGERVAHTR